MKVAVKGNKLRLEELVSVLSSEVEVIFFEDIASIENTNDFDAVFDLNFDENTDQSELYGELEVPLFLSAVTVNLHAYFSKQVYGINALPTFLSRSTLEVCGTKGVNKSMDALVLAMGWESIEWVNCRVGMITPRVICMIINEAFYTVQEGTASKEDIDKGMKMGTAYPMGPFEWCDKIGIANVYNVLDAMWQDTREERYKICPLLKTAYLQN